MLAKVKFDDELCYISLEHQSITLVVNIDLTN